MPIITMETFYVFTGMTSLTRLGKKHSTSSNDWLCELLLKTCSLCGQQIQDTMRFSQDIRWEACCPPRKHYVLWHLFVSARLNPEIRMPWEFGNLGGPLQGHISTNINLEWPQSNWHAFEKTWTSSFPGTPTIDFGPFSERSGLTELLDCPIVPANHEFEFP